MTPQTRRLASPDAVWNWTVRLHRRADLLCAAFVLCGLLAWWVWVDAGPVRTVSAAMPATRLRWLETGPSRPETAWRTDVRALSSPLLFALPTPLGFSRDALAPAGLKPPPPVTFTSSVAGYLVAPSDVIARLDRSSLLEQVPSNRQLPWPAIDTSSLSAVRADGAAVLSGALSGRPALSRLIPLGTNQPVLTEQPWDVLAQIRVDADGWIERVLLEKATSSSNRNAALVRLLRGTNLGRGEAGEGRIALRYEGRNGGGAP